MLERATTRTMRHLPQTHRRSGPAWRQSPSRQSPSGSSAAPIGGPPSPSRSRRCCHSRRFAEGRIAFSAAFVASLGFDLAGAYDLAFDGSHPLYGTPVRLYRPRAAAGVPCGR